MMLPCISFEWGYFMIDKHLVISNSTLKNNLIKQPFTRNYTLPDKFKKVLKGKKSEVNSNEMLQLNTMWNHVSLSGTDSHRYFASFNGLENLNAITNETKCITLKTNLARSSESKTNGIHMKKLNKQCHKCIQGERLQLSIKQDN